MHYLLHYDYVDDIVERRAPHREAHLAMARARHGAGEMVMAGAVGDPPHSALFVFTSAGAAEDFAAADPYIAAGLVTAHRVEPWNVVIGPSSPE